MTISYHFALAINVSIRDMHIDYQRHAHRLSKTCT